MDHDFALVCRDVSELSEYAKVDNTAFRLMKNNTPGAYTFIFKATKEVPRRLMNPKKKTIGIRIPDNAIAQALLEELNEPLFSTTLIMPGADMAEYDPEHIRDILERRVDLILNGGYLGEKPTTVIDFPRGMSILFASVRATLRRLNSGSEVLSSLFVDKRNKR